MRLYTFYPVAPDGTPLSSIAVELAHDEDAVAHAAELQLGHPACAEVVVWDAGRLVFTLTGPHAGEEAD